MALNPYVLTATVTIAAGTAIATPTAGEPGTGGAAGFGNAGISAGFAPWPQTFTEGQAILLDPAGPLFTAIGSGNLRAYMQGTDDVGHGALSN